MPQAFSPAGVLFLKLAALAGLTLAIGACFVARWRMQPAAAIGEPVDQPIRFSHAHHVGDDGIDCRYCHATVETSAFAGMPSTHVCLDCHSQLFVDSPELAPLWQSVRERQPLRWNRVHDLPDFAYFDHSIHVAKGVACQECHGRVDRMPMLWREASLDMQWCLACHRDAAHHVRPRAGEFAMHDTASLSEFQVQQLVREYRLQDTRRLTDCSTCHR
jgi:hypothetical protein